jgi:DNA mismatch repair protein MSH3
LLQERVDAVEEIIESGSEKLLTLRETLKGLPDLAKGLTRVQYGQVIPMPLPDCVASNVHISLVYASGASDITHRLQQDWDSIRLGKV